MAKESNPFEREDFKGEVLEEYSGVSEDEADRLVLEELQKGALIFRYRGTSSIISTSGPQTSANMPP